MKSKQASLTSLLLAVLWVCCLPSPAVHAKVLLEDTVWEGEVLVEENLLILPGITLTVRGNTVVNIIPADNTRTDPEYMSSLTEITVRGSLIVEGTNDAPVIFRINPEDKAGGSWAGIIVDGGTARLRSCTVRDAETGVWALAGTVDLPEATLVGNQYGLVAQQEKTKVTLDRTRITGNQYGVLLLNGVQVDLAQARISGNLKKDTNIAEEPAAELSPKNLSAPAGLKTPKEVGDEVLQGDVVWEGHVRVTGLVRVPSGGRLIILPGTLVEFTKKDTNGDGIGENGLMLQGVLLAKGTADRPIFFRGADRSGNKGEWDAVNIINSDGARNLIEYCQFEDAYRGLHFHFTNAVVQYSVFRNNHRGIQFQESTVELRGNSFTENTSAIQARDSEIAFRNNQVMHNTFGANFFRAHLAIEDNRFANNLDFGLKVREGYPTVAGNVFDHNRFGLMFSDTTYGSVTGNLLLFNSEAGVSVRTGSNMEFSGNFVQENGLSGMALRESVAVIRNNFIAGNGERGIGLISFQGPISENLFSDTRLYAIAAEDGADVDAPGNWFDRADLDAIIFDQHDDSSRGQVRYAPVADKPLQFTWPQERVPLSLHWSGRIQLAKTVTVPAGITLAIDPGTSVLFARDAGMKVQGRLLALGSRERRIRFTAAGSQEPESWDEIQLEYAEGSRMANCDFEYATWAIHCHFTAMPVVGCTFRSNGGGLRFRSGPMLIKNSLFQNNNIGIRAYLGRAEIINNIITENEKGIFVREQGSGLKITGNNIFNNTDYNIWVGDFNREDIQAPGNWWGTDDPAGTIFDARREPGIGTVLFDPPLAEAVEISIADPEQP